MKHYPLTSILVAVKNEELNIRSCLERVYQTCQSAGMPIEVLVIDGGNDGTEKIVRSLTETLPGLRYLKNVGDKGKGHATRVGISEARGEIIAQVDADLQFPPEQLPLLLEPILAGRAEMTLGSRFMASSTRSSGSQNFRRHFGNYVVSGLASLLFVHRMTDVMAGFKAWKRQVTGSYQLLSNTYSYEVELAVRAIGSGYSVVDVPILTEPRTAGTSSVRVFRDGMKTIFDICRFRLICPLPSLARKTALLLLPTLPFIFSVPHAASQAVLQTASQTAAEGSCPKKPANELALSKTGERTVTAKELQSLLTQNKVLLIDVRSAKDFAQAHIKGAISLPIESKPETLLKTLAPDCDKKIVIYCSQQLFPTRMVALSSMGTAQLEAMGYTDVAQLELLWDSQSLNGSLEPDSSSGGPSFEIEGNDTAKSPLKRYAKKPKS